jgi:multidrug resistance efflux pump
MRRLSPFVFVAALAAILALAGCSAKPVDPAGRAGTVPGATPGAAPAAGRSGAPQGQQGGRRFATIPVQAVTVQQGTLVTDNDTAGTVVAVTQSPVAAQVAGVVAKVARTQGDWVGQGAMVVQLDDSALKLAVKNAEAALENAKINLAVGQQTSTGSGPKLANQLESSKTLLSAAQKNYDSQKKLYDLGGISSSQLDSAQSQLQQAQANVQSAQLALDQNQQAGSQTLAQMQLAVDQASVQLQIAELNLRNAQITAPFAGQLAAINVTPGMYVSLNTSVFVLVSTDKQINFTVPPSDAPNIRAGDTVQFTYAGHSYPVRIVQSPSAPINGVVPVVAELPKAVPASYGAVGTISYKLKVATGSLIPIAALVTRADQDLVYAIVDGKAVEQPITMIAEAGTTAVVKGIEAGTQIVVSPPPGLLAGSTVQAVVLPQQGPAPAGAASPQPKASGGAPTQQGPAPARPGGAPQKQGTQPAQGGTRGSGQPGQGGSS